MKTTNLNLQSSLVPRPGPNEYADHEFGKEEEQGKTGVDEAKAKRTPTIRWWKGNVVSPACGRLWACDAHEAQDDNRRRVLRGLLLPQIPRQACERKHHLQMAMRNVKRTLLLRKGVPQQIPRWETGSPRLQQPQRKLLAVCADSSDLASRHG